MALDPYPRDQRNHTEALNFTIARPRNQEKQDKRLERTNVIKNF